MPMLWPFLLLFVLVGGFVLAVFTGDWPWLIPSFGAYAIFKTAWRKT